MALGHELGANAAPLGWESVRLRLDFQCPALFIRPLANFSACPPAKWPRCLNALTTV